MATAVVLGLFGHHIEDGCTGHGSEGSKAGLVAHERIDQKRRDEARFGNVGDIMLRQIGLGRKRRLALALAFRGEEFGTRIRWHQRCAGQPVVFFSCFGKVSEKDRLSR